MNVILFKIIKGVIIDGMIKICGKKKRIIRIKRRIYIENMEM